LTVESIPPVSGRLASDPGSPDVDATHGANGELFCDPERWRNWARITPFFNYPLDIRKAIYTTNSVESLNWSLRKIIKTRGGFANEEAALKLLFLALRQAAKKWTMPIHHWREALNHFTILWPERMPVPGESCLMEAQNLSTSLGEGRDPAPFLAHPSPKTKTSRLHRRFDTPRNS
jgi:hypothetical protein